MDNGRYPDDYESYLYEFHATRDYFECHELLEDYWKANPGDGYGHAWVGLIQLAVGSYHHRRDNLHGASKMYRQAFRRLEAGQLNELGIDGQELLSRIDRRIAAAENGETFADLMIPIVDEALLERLRASAEANGIAWGAPSSADQALVHRHMLRDRSDVIAARAAAAAQRSRPSSG
ncbi:DUF309 domain-containing protein [Paenibacillus sacheonensis]|uniref:DUF309 domain-containing protein n=1 Tax=Paenibacillus sacheonensis TaxID=742054 RepID=UPI003083FE3B|nr:putative metal-dependent hydrolase [Paenibacillus sacheonensis]